MHSVLQKLGGWFRALFQARPGEGQFVLLLFATYGLVIMSERIAFSTTNAQYLKVVGVRWLPAVLMFRAVVSVLATSVYTAYCDLVRNDRLMVVMLAIAAVCFAGAQALAFVWSDAGVVLLYVFAQSLSVLFTLHWGVYLADYFKRSEAKRLYPGIYSGARVGGLLGGALMAGLAPIIGAEALNFLVAGLLVGAVGTVVLGSAKRFQRFENVSAADESARKESAKKGRWANMKEGLSYLRTSRFIRLTAICTVLLIFTRNIVVVASNTVFERSFPDEDSLTAFFGYYALIAGGIAFVMQLGAAGRFIEAMGIARPNLTYTVLLMLSTLGIAIVPTLPAAIAGRFAENELRTSLKVPVTNLLYTGVPTRVRARARALSSGMTVPLATFVISAIQLVTVEYLSLQAHAAIGVGIGLLYVYTTHLQNRAFIKSLAERAAVEAVGQSGIAATPTPAPREELERAPSTLMNPEAPRIERFRALAAAPGDRIERPLREAVVRALTDELEAAVQLLAHARTGAERARGRLVAFAAEDRCRYVLALLGAWAAPKMRFAVMEGFTQPVGDIVQRVKAAEDVLHELVSAKAVERVLDTVSRFESAQHGRLPLDGRPLDAMERAGAWLDPWLSAGLVLQLRTGDDPRELALVTGLTAQPVIADLVVNPRAKEDDGPWARMSIAERVSRLLQYPLFLRLPLQSLELLARSNAGADIGERILGSGRGARRIDPVVERRFAEYEAEAHDSA